MPRLLIAIILFAAIATAQSSPKLLQTHCYDCHNEDKAKGKFELSHLGDAPTDKSLDLWLDALDYVATGEMPPEDDSNITETERETLTKYFQTKVAAFESANTTNPIPPRRLNNREFKNSVADVLLIEDIGTHLPADNLLGDSLYHGFDTHAETLGFSKFHLEQYIHSLRRILDATILPADQPHAQIHRFPATKIYKLPTRQNVTRPTEYGNEQHYDLKRPDDIILFKGFESVPHTGYYHITIRATGLARKIYPTSETGIYHDDPIRIQIKMGDRIRTIELPDEKPTDIHLNEWLAKGTRIELSYPTDGLKIRGNGNFKFQQAIAAEFLKENDPEAYQARVAEILASPGINEKKKQNLDTWHNWVNQWNGPRARLYSATITGPLYESWPPKRQQALLGENPKIENAREILRPIATRAYRRPVTNKDLKHIVSLVEQTAATGAPPEASLTEGIIALLSSPDFLLLGHDHLTPEQHFATKLSYLLHSTTPSKELQKQVETGNLNTFNQLLAHLKESTSNQNSPPTFLREFPFGWLELTDINFMSPDPERYRFYHKKQLSEDMTNEALMFFRHIITENRPLPELLTADYSFINADLAAIYGIDNIPQDSVLRKHTFTDGRRGGLLGTGAFLTLTADSLGTSPIHRAVYVMENFLGIHPTPPPPDVEITEPDVRKATTIKEILNAHTANESCASCHAAIDPYGYAFENFGPTGAWRSHYALPSDNSKKPRGTNPDIAIEYTNEELWQKVGIPIDSSAKFRSGYSYTDIHGFRKFLQSDANRDRFIRCFITKLLTYANGAEPTKADYNAITEILNTSAQHDYRILETITATLHSPLFRNHLIQ